MLIVENQRIQGILRLLVMMDMATSGLTEHGDTLEQL